MADVTISQLNPAVSVSNSDVVAISTGTQTLRATISQIGVPIGTIVMWSNRGGASIPSGWQLCDGTNDTPDLRGRFIVGSGQGTGLSNYNIGNTGGAESVTLTTAQIPAHTHTFSNTPVVYQNSAGSSPQYRPSGAQTTGTTGSTGGGGSHENRPPYYALAFIIKIS